MLNLLNYQIDTPLFESISSMIYRAKRVTDQQPVILKLLKTDYPTPSQIHYYQQEYQILSQLNQPGVIKAYSLESYQHRPLLVLEDIGGQSLRDWLQQRTYFPLREWLSLAIHLADNLGHLHAAQVIHKDLNPGNIVWNPLTGQLKLIDFGLATLLPRENVSLKNPNQLEGTLPYLSPEQTGRMNRTIDYRTDLYSLGVTLYELLTGHLPFDGQEPLEWIHCHLAKSPLPPSHWQTEMSPVVSHILLRLLAKTAEERYQSAWGLKADLETVQAQLTQGNLEFFELGQQDVSDRFQLPQRLYGRDEEIAELLAAFARVTQGPAEWLLVAGYSGVGKSSLVREIYKPITAQTGFFLSGKFDQFQRNIPYSAVVNAFQELVQQLLTEEESKLTHWRNQLLQALGSHGQIIIDVIPAVELIIGPQPVVPTLLPTEEQNRFSLVFKNFIRVFAQVNHPLVIFLDDLQWADSASLKLLKLLMTDIPYLFLLGAYRDNEVSASHPLMTTLDELKPVGVTVTTLTLTTLQLPEIQQLLADTFKTQLPQVYSLAYLVLDKTAGNPFFMNEFLKTLAYEQLVRFNSQARTWQWDLAQIRAKNITDNVVELMADKVKQLPTPTQQLLKLAAGLGNQFELATLAIVTQIATAQIKTQLWPALVEGLIVKLEGENYKFIHDRVQQAVYSLIPESSKSEWHWQIGQLLWQASTASDGDKRIFEVVDHLNLGLNCLPVKEYQAKLGQPSTVNEENLPTVESVKPLNLAWNRRSPQEQRDEIIQLNLRAAQKARLASAYYAALTYYHQAIALLPLDDTWETHYDLTLTLYRGVAEAEFLNGHFVDSAHFISLMLVQVKTNYEKADILLQVVVQQTMQAQYEAAIATAGQALHLLELDLPTTETIETDLSQVFTEVKTILGNREIASLIYQPENTHSRYQLAIKLYISIDPASYIIGNLNLYMYVSVKAVVLSLQYGSIAESAKGYANYGLILGSGLGDFQTGYQFGCLAVEVSKKFQSLAYECKADLLLGNWIHSWSKPLREAKKYNLDGYQAGLESGELQFAGYNLFGYFTNCLVEGDPLPEVQRRLKEYLPMVNQLKNDLTTDGVLGIQLAINLLTGTTESLLRYGQAISVSEYQSYCRPSALAYASYCTFSAQAYYILDQPTAAWQLLETAQDSLAGIFGFTAAFEYNFYHSLVLLALAETATATQRTAYLTQVTEHQSQMQQWMANCPSNFEPKWLLVAAELARLAGQTWQAIDYYDRAIESAQTAQFTPAHALANELAGKFWRRQGKPKIAKLYLHEAFYSYQCWGATVKLEQLTKQYPSLLTIPHLTSQSAQTNLTSTLKYTFMPSSHSPHESNTTSVFLDLYSLLKASQALSGEMVLDKLLNRIMHTVIENAGAQRGVLILQKNQEWVVEAEGADSSSIVVLQSLPLTGRVPLSVINYVIRTKQQWVLTEASGEGWFQNDEYIRTHQIKSLLCSPIIHQQQLVGIIYLENNLAAGVFTADRLQMINLLATQMATSLENARFVSELEHARQAADSANYTKTAFLANVSHELRTPLNSILGNTQWLLSPNHGMMNLDLTTFKKLSNLESDPLSLDLTTFKKLSNLESGHSVIQAIQAIQTNGEHLLSLVNDIIDISRIQTEQLEIQPVEFRLHPFLERLVAIFRERTQQKGLTFTYQPDEALPEIVVADEKRLRQILLQLLSNAIKFTAQGAVIFQVNNEYLTADHHGGLQFVIIDSGVGIAAEDLAKICLPFEQLSDWQHKSKGIGLGLFFAKQLVERMGGQFQIDSEIGQGSQFTITVPVLEFRFDNFQKVVKSPELRFDNFQQVVKSEVANSEGLRFDNFQQVVKSPELRFDNFQQVVKSPAVVNSEVQFQGPSNEQAAELFELISLGDLFGIQDWATAIKQTQPELIPFATYVQQLAMQYEDDKLCQLAQKYLV